MRCHCQLRRHPFWRKQVHIGQRIRFSEHFAMTIKGIKPSVFISDGAVALQAHPQHLGGIPSVGKPQVNTRSKGLCINVQHWISLHHELASGTYMRHMHLTFTPSGTCSEMLL